MYHAMFDYVRDIILKSVSSGDPRYPFRCRFAHTMRVYAWAQQLLKTEHGDSEEVLIAAIFHDVGYAISVGDDHALFSAEIAKAYLTNIGYDPHKLGKIVYLVAMHSEKKRPIEQLCPEMRILMDADLLDEVGAMTAMWDFMDEGKRGGTRYDLAYQRLEGVYPRLKAKCSRMKTATGVKLYNENVAFLRMYLDKLRSEMHFDNPDLANYYRM